ncbi:glycosyltransferase family 2 protein [Empedobacter stercoris]|uniref:glycosyltransferase family 2 protein n=1 Tax=Empedobacter stercoris TaxID=1628248 RepID=UPI001CE16E1B|nr:glycosyltransferase family 2 protein [Empedobacter stercoris]MCA4777329.1 glycosyltransferase family 2 protein [Empedobacter stercoris]
MEIDKDFKKPLISIIVPVYNVEKYLDKCLTSLKNQIFVNFEILLINDGSTDKSGYICEDFAQKDYRFKVIHQENKGVSSARNVGLNNAIGKYIAFVDSDDWITENYLLDFVNEIPESDYFIIIQNAYDFDDERKSLKFSFTDNIYNLTDDFFQLFYTHNELEYGYLWNKFFVNEIIQNNNLRFDTKMLLFEDEEFYYKYLIKIDNIITSSKSNYFYVSRYDSAVKKQWDINNYLLKYDLRINLFRSLMEFNIINNVEFIKLNEKYFNKYLYFIFKEHIYMNKDLRISNMNKMSVFLDKYLIFYNQKNLRLKIILYLIKYKKYNFASFLIEKLLK